MPKKQAQRRIDKQSGTGSRTVTITTTGGGSGSGGVAAHGLASSAHTGTLAESQAPWAVTQTEFDAHTADADAHHNRLHDILGVNDHEITAAAYTLVGATLTDTLGKLYIASSGDGIDVTKSGGNFTIDADVSDFVGDGLRDDGSNNVAIKPADFAGNGLIESSYDLHVGAGDGITVGSNDVAVDESYDFEWTGDHTFAATLGSPSYVSGFAGGGWRIDTNDASMQLNDLTVRGLLRVYELLVQQIRATNGSIFVSAGAKIASAEVVAGSTYELTVEADESDTDIQPFAVNDLIRAQRWTGQGTYQCDMRVSSINQGGDPLVFRASLEAGNAPAAGMEFVRLGNTSDGDRQGSIYLSADDNEAPFIDIIDSVESFAAWASTNKVKARLGNLTGITDPDMGVLSGYGLYTENGYFRGTIAAGGGNTWITEDNGLTLQSTSTGGSDDSWITFATDPTSVTGGTRTGYIFGSKIDTAGTVRGGIDAYAFSGATNTTDIGHIGLYTQDDGEYDSFILIESGSTQHQITISSYNGSESAFGTIAVVGNGDWTGHVVPNADGTYDLGSASKAWRSLYVDTLYAGTVSSVDTGHNHNDLYYTEAEIDSLLSGKSDTGHTHAGYVTSVSLATTLGDYVTSSGLTTTLADYYTEAEADALLADKSAVGHTHDSRYYTEAEVDALIAGVAAAAHTHDDRYYTETEIDALLTDYVTSSGLSTTLGSYVTSAGLTATLGGYYSEAEVDALLTDYSLTTHTHTSLPLASITHGGSTTISIDADGTMGSANYDADAATGWSIGPDRQIFSNVEITGTMAAAVFELGSTVVGASEQLFTAGGGGALKEPLTIDTTNGDFTYTIAVEDPKLGHTQIAVAGDWLLIQGIAYAAPKTVAEGSVIAEWEFLPTVADTTPQQSIREVWGLVTDVSDETTHFEYDITIDDVISRTGYFTFPAGTAIANLKGITDDVGGITITGRPGTGPYLNVWSLRETGAGSPFLRSHVRVGLLESLAVGNANEYGIAAGTDLSDSTEPYIIASNERILLSNVEQRITDDAGTAMQLSADSGLDFFYTSTTEADQARRVSWVNDAETFEHFYIGPDMFYGGYLGMRVKAEDAGYYSGMHIWAGPDPADWDVGSSAEYPDDYAGLIIETPLGGDGRISIRAQSIAVYGSMTTEQIAPSAIDASGLATDSTGLATGQVYVDAAGYLRMA